MGNAIMGSCCSPDGIKNCCCAGPNGECCKCCYCCLGEENHVARVLRHYPAVPLAQAPNRAHQFTKTVGRITLPPFETTQAVSQCMYSPGSQKPCVYWRVVVEEEWIKIEDRRDNRGRHHSESTSWRKIVDHENYVDFYLQDGSTKLFINGRKRNQCKIQSTWDEGGSTWCRFSHHNLPSSIKWMIHRHATGFGGWHRSWHHRGRIGHGPTGNFRWSECLFAVNEKITALGLLTAPMPDPYTQSQTMCLIPVDTNTISPEMMGEEDWSRWDRW